MSVTLLHVILNVSNVTARHVATQTDCLLTAECWQLARLKFSNRRQFECKYLIRNFVQISVEVYGIYGIVQTKVLWDK
jgi:ABC-type maltose transport system permease subunit